MKFVAHFSNLFILLAITAGASAKADCVNSFVCSSYDYALPVNITNSSSAPGLTVVGGNVGFGTLTPAQALSVVGVIESTTGGFKFPDGTIQTTAGGGGGSSQWTTSGSNISYVTGKVGIGTTTPGQPLSVVGVIESTTGGFKFPDGTVQATASSASGASVRTVTSNYTATTSDDLIQGNGSGGITITLPGSSTCSGKTFKIRNISASSDLILTPASGDTIEGGSSLSLTRKQDYVELISTGAAWSISSSRLAPTTQIFLSSTGTYTTPAGVHHLRVRMVGGGGGGSGSGSAAGSAVGSGGATTFGGTLVQAGGGGNGLWGSFGGSGGTAAVVGQTGIAVNGSSGQGGGTSSAAIAALVGGSGGSSAFGGAGGGGAFGANGVGLSATANSGSGGGGAGITNPSGVLNYTGSGGGSGAYAEATIAVPNSSYAYVIGAGGSGGTAGTNGKAGGNGAAGQIIVEEFYQ
jgi:hypothetical protein